MPITGLLILGLQIQFSIKTNGKRHPGSLEVTHLPLAPEKSLQMPRSAKKNPTTRHHGLRDPPRLMASTIPSTASVQPCLINPHFFRMSGLILNCHWLGNYINASPTFLSDEWPVPYMVGPSATWDLGIVIHWSKSLSRSFQYYTTTIPLISHWIRTVIALPIEFALLSHSFKTHNA